MISTWGCILRSILLVSSILLAAAGNAMAADAASVEPGFGWSGFYVGAQAGYGWGDVDSHNVGRETGVTDWRDSWNANGGLGGIHVGYNHAFNQLVVGAEADLEVSGAKGAVESDYAGLVENQIEVQGSLRARLGYSVGPALFYATGGLAVARIETTYDGDADRWTHTKSGWTVGGGVEYALSRNWTTRIDYRYTDFGSFTENPATDSGFNHVTELKTQAVRFGVSYKF